MASSFLTFTKVIRHHGIPDDDWQLNGQYNYIEFKNGSRIDLLDVAYKPSDPLYERFGSLEYTGGWLEEAGEVDFMAFDVLKSRIGRHKNKDFGIPSKIYLTCNPTKGWLYKEIYRKSKDGVLPLNTKFVQSLYSDNPHTSTEYKENLSEIQDKATKERLMFGNWEYDDDPSTLIEYDAICDLFSNTVDEYDTKYITADIARHGQDKTVVMVWYGYEAKFVMEWQDKGLDVTALKIKDLAAKYKVPFSKVIIDEDGVGGGVVDMLRGVKGFVNNSKPFLNRVTGKPDNFQNLKTQCYYLLAEYINNHRLAVRCDMTQQEQLTEELEQVKKRDADKDGKLKMQPKDKMKEMIGRSPDYADAMMMRMYFEFFQRPEKVISPASMLLGTPMTKRKEMSTSYE